MKGLEGEQKGCEPAAGTQDRTRLSTHSLIYPALLSEPHGPQGCGVSTF